MKDGCFEIDKDVKYPFRASLSQDLFRVKADGKILYGGSQNVYPTAKEKASACGIAAAADVVLYLKCLATGIFDVEKDDFISISRIIKKFVPIIPGRGVNSFILAIGLNRFFKKSGLRFHAKWKCTEKKKWEITERMLKDDIPVILAIGNNYPFIWRENGLNLYVPDGPQQGVQEVVFKKVQAVCGHFVVATAIDGNVLTVSSWGRKYYINTDEYDRYVKKHSIHLYCNILSIKKII